MTFQQFQQAYAVAVGTTSTVRNLLMSRDPDSSDVNYDLGQFWQNTVDESIWYLNSKTSVLGYVQANWITIEAAINSLSDTANTPVTASSGTDTPPSNIQLINLDGSIDITSDPSNHRIIIDSAGGSIGVDSFTPDVGTNPVVPDGTGLVAIQGQSTPSTSGIRVTGGTNRLDFAMYSPFVGDFTFSGSVSGGTRFLSIINSSNTASSNSALFLTVGGSSSANPYIGFAIPLAQSWAAGIDNSDSDSFKITSAATLASNERFSISTSGAVQFNNVYTFPTADGLAGQALVTDGSGNITFGGSSGFSAYTNVSTTPYVVLASDQYISVNTGVAITINMPNTTTTGRIVRVKDRTGTASSNNITVTTPGGTVTFDGSTSYVININYGEAAFIFGGTNYEVF